MKKKKTEISRKSYNEHIWNEAFTFNLPSSTFNNAGLEVRTTFFMRDVGNINLKFAALHSG